MGLLARLTGKPLTNTFTFSLFPKSYRSRALIVNPPHEKAAAAYEQGAQCSVKAAEAWAQKKTQEAACWYHAGEMYRNQAEEFNKNPPHEKAAEAYGQGAHYRVKAAEAEAQGKNQEAACWHNAGVMCSNQAEELAKNPPHERAAEAYGKGVESFVKAAEAEALKKTQEATYWNNAGKVCYNQAEELANNLPHEKAAAAYGQSAEYCVKAAEAEAQGKTQEATYWNDAGWRCHNQALELDKDTPNEAAAAAYGQGAECCVKAAEAEAQGKTQEARYWYHAGEMWSNQAKELCEKSTS